MAAAPVRTCIGCRARRSDQELIRVTLRDGQPVIGRRADPRGPGRGAWICGQAGCIEAAAASRAFSRAFRAKLADRYFADTLLGWLGKPSR